MLGTTNASSKSGGSTETITITASLASDCDFGIIVGGTPITSSGTYTVPKYSLCTISSKEFWTWIEMSGSSTSSNYAGSTFNWSGSLTAPSDHTVTRKITLFSKEVASPVFTSSLIAMESGIAYNRDNTNNVKSYWVSKKICDTFQPFSTTFEVASNIKITVTGTGTAGKLTVTNS